MSIERQELYCHGCGNYVRFDLDLGVNGNHVLTCPSCGHKHCRVIKDGRITGDRWDSRNGPSVYVTYAHVYSSSASNTYCSTWTIGSWLNTTVTS